MASMLTKPINTGGNTPALVSTNQPQSLASRFAAPASTYGQDMRSGAEMIQGNLESFLNPNSQLIQRARQQGMNLAAQRGGINSSIAAGAAEKAALDKGEQLAAAATNIDLSREQVAAQDWMAERGFNREFQGALAMMPINNAASMAQAVQQFALRDPELYTPDVISGYTNFFDKNFSNVMAKYFGGGE